MSYQKLLQQMIGVTLVVLLLAGCNVPAATPTPVVIVVTATPQATPTSVVPSPHSSPENLAEAVAKAASQGDGAQLEELILDTTSWGSPRTQIENLLKCQGIPTSDLRFSVGHALTGQLWVEVYQGTTRLFTIALKQLGEDWYVDWVISNNCTP